MIKCKVSKLSVSKLKKIQFLSKFNKHRSEYAAYTNILDRIHHLSDKYFVANSIVYCKLVY
jgi:hypothetical protein